MLRIVTVRTVTTIIQRVVVRKTITQLCEMHDTVLMSDDVQTHLQLLQQLRQTLHVLAEYTTTLEIRHLEAQELDTEEQLTEYRVNSI